MRHLISGLAALLLLVAPAHAQGVKISDLPAAAALTGNEILPTVQTGVTKKVTAQAIANLYATNVIGANTVLGNFTSGSVAPTPQGVPSCSTTDNFLQYTSASGFSCAPVSGGGSVVTSIAGNTGAFTLGPGLTNTVNQIEVAAGQVPGTATNDNAVAGNVGEYISSSVGAGSAIAAASNTVFDVTSVTLTPGDWDVTGNVAFVSGGGGIIASPAVWVSSVATTAPTPPNGGAYFSDTVTRAADTTNIFPTGSRRFTVPASTTLTVYVSGVTFSTGTLAAYGFIGARRAR